jgi:signal transduction histidine kinase
MPGGTRIVDSRVELSIPRKTGAVDETRAVEVETEVVIGSDGTVLAVRGDLPSTIVDRHVGECEGLAVAIRDAGRALLQQLHRSGARVAVEKVRLGGGLTVRLTAVEALVMRRAPTDIRVLLDSKLSVVSFQASAANVTFRVAVDDNVPAIVHVDAEKLAWAVTTLVGNALRYVQAGSRRTVRGTVVVKVAFEASRSQLTIDVQDDGPGIPADTVARLFKRDGLNVRGAGLALLVMSDICAAHGGGFAVQSSVDPVNHRTCVSMTIPVLTGTPAR